MLELYCIEGISNLCKRELEGPEYNTPTTWPTFQEDWAKLKEEIITYVQEEKPRVGLGLLKNCHGREWF